MLLNGLILDSFSHDISEHSISPFMSLLIELAIQLPHRDRFGVEDMRMHLGEGFLLVQSCDRLLQRNIIACLTTSCWSHQHQTVSHLNRIIQLQHLIHEGFDWLKPHLVAH